MDEYHIVGVRGIQVNFGGEGSGAKIAADLSRAAAIARRMDWVVELWMPIDTFLTLHAIIPTLGSAWWLITMLTLLLVLAQATRQTGLIHFKLRALADLVKNHYVCVKISVPYQKSKKAPLYNDMRAIAEILITNGPNMVVFGSDWPHTSSKEGNAEAGGRLVPQVFRDIDGEALIEQTKSWAASKAHIQRLFVGYSRRLRGCAVVDS